MNVYVNLEKHILFPNSNILVLFKFSQFHKIFVEQFPLPGNFNVLFCILLYLDRKILKLKTWKS